MKEGRNNFAAAHVAPINTGDVADDPRARVVVLLPEFTYKKSNGTSTAEREARNYLENRGSSPRLYRNMLVFLAADQNDAEAWEHALREHLAWQSISDEEEQLNLDAQQRKQVKSNLQRTDETVRVRLQETYCWLLVPAQPDPTGDIEFQSHRIPGQESFYERAIRKLRQSGLLIPQWSADTLLLEMEQYNLWRDGSHVIIKQLWEYLARYCYLPRLYDQNVLIDAIRNGISRADAPFGYATLARQDGTYRGLIYQQPVSTIVVDENAVIVRAEMVAAQLEQEQVELAKTTSPRTIGTESRKTGEHGVIAPPPQLAPVVLKTRYHGTVSLNPLRTNKDMSIIVEEIVQRLTSLTGTDVEITVEISAERPAGFDDGIIRTISENSRTLKFRSHGFE